MSTLNCRASDSPQATLARVEEIIHTLRERVVCEGWRTNGGTRVDEAAAERVLAYLRQQAAAHESWGDVPCDHPEFVALLDFLEDHGQSSQWAFFGDPIGMICKGAAHSPRMREATGLRAPEGMSSS
jgi:hypothetical protein